ncbi:short-chain-enoyl-CoA hydratase [Clostridium sp.]|jgi:enoyl-CoA hydratase|uniref:short-chain-enoyl-CoA hydratase n=1 Tax=Clostridium sp. TaxID=1506 RepID=UPI003EF081BB
MEFQNLLYKKVGNIGILSINNPKSLNALNLAIFKEINAAIDMVEADEEVYVLIITGEGKAFVAGADIEEMKSLNVEESRKFGKIGSDVFRKIELMEKPVIAAVNGFALGGGCELAMSCDIRIASEKAKLGLPEVSLGITPGFSGTLRLPRLVGIAKAKELIYTGNIISAEDAEKIGLVNKVVPQEELMSITLNLANKIASVAQIAVKYSKSAINRGIETDIETGMAMENDIFGLCFATKDQREGMTAFIEKRKPVFQNK